MTCIQETIIAAVGRVNRRQGKKRPYLYVRVETIPQNLLKYEQFAAKIKAGEDIVDVRLRKSGIRKKNYIVFTIRKPESHYILQYDIVKIITLCPLATQTPAAQTAVQTPTVQAAEQKEG